MMDLSERKWRIIRELSSGDKTPTQLSKKLGITLPSVLAHLRELENKKIVRKAGSLKGRTRPYAQYSIGAGFVYLIEALPNRAKRGFLKTKDTALSKELIMRRILQNRSRLKAFGVRKLTLIGSYARGEAGRGSDIDFLVEFEKNRGLFDDYAHLLQFLEGLFGKGVDLGDAHLLREEMKAGVLGGEKVEAEI